MNGKDKFFSLDALRQPVNQWLCIAFLALFCFWTVLYYVTAKAHDIGEGYEASLYGSLKQ